MRLNKVKAYTKYPGGGFHIELQDDYPVSPGLEAAGNPYEDDDLMPPGVARPRLQRVKHPADD